MSNSQAFSKQSPDGEDRERLVCDSCAFVAYVNPKIVVGSVVTRDDYVLICRRAIEPRYGFWTLPAGYLEEGESVEEGARREAREEACAEIELQGLLAYYSVPHLSQVRLMFRARLIGDVAPGPESLEVKRAPWADIPWTELAFPSVAWAPRQYQAWNGTIFSKPV